MVSPASWRVGQTGEYGMKRALVIGGGFAGCAAAHQLSLLGGWDIDLVERAPFLGGGVKTHWRGGHPFTFGPRHFLTPPTTCSPI